MAGQSTVATLKVSDPTSGPIKPTVPVPELQGPSQAAALPKQRQDNREAASSRRGGLQPRSEASKQWSDLFKAKSKPCTAFQLQKWDDNMREIKEEELRDFGICLVGFVLGRFPGIQAIDKVRNSWGVQTTFTIHDSGWLVFRFNSEEDRDGVLQKGPFDTNGSPWFLKKMPKFFRFNPDFFNTIPTWIRLQGLPLDFWSQTCLGKLASYVGNPIAADHCTAEILKTSYARLLVEVDVTKPLVRDITFKLPNGNEFCQKVTYEREPRYCSQCKMLGHMVMECRRNKAKAPNSVSPAPHAVPSACPAAPAPAEQAQEGITANTCPTVPTQHPHSPSIKQISPVKQYSTASQPPNSTAGIGSSFSPVLVTEENAQQTLLAGKDGKGKGKMVEHQEEEDTHDSAALDTAVETLNCDQPPVPSPLVNNQQRPAQRKKQNKKNRSGKVRGTPEPSPSKP